MGGFVYELPRDGEFGLSILVPDNILYESQLEVYN